MTRTAAALVAGLLATACGNSTAPPAFSEQASATGLTFVHEAGMRGDLLLPEITGSGVGLIDYDGDGDLDVFFAQGAFSGAQPEPDCADCNRLYRNLLVESGALAFRDVTATAGELGRGFAVGVAAGDIDNDGDTDLFVSGVGADYLLRNDDGVFVDVTDAAGVSDDRWNASASFADYNRDGDLDLFVTAYLADPVAANRDCHNRAGQRDYCSPSNFEPLPDRLYANDGAGRFTDVSATAGIAQAAGAGLGVVAADFDGDGQTDFYVANDQTANHLWLADGDGGFRQQALLAGAAYNGDGRAEASMGLSAADYDGDGDEDLFMTHLNTETNTLYRNDGAGHFVDATHRAGLGAASLPYTGWGALWFDADHDGDLDLFVANGAVTLDSAQGDADPYGQPDQLWRNDGGAYAVDAGALPALAPLSSRGAAFGDIDNDGDIDVVVSAVGGPARLYRNDGARGNWLQVRLVDTVGNRDGVGARIAALAPDGTATWRRVASDGSFASANDLRVHFGLGEVSRIDIGVVWADGERERFDGLATNRQVLLRRGEGRPWPTD